MKNLFKDQQILAIIADSGFPAHGKTKILKLLSDVAEIRIDDLAGENLVPGADNLDVHAGHSPGQLLPTLTGAC